VTSGVTTTGDPGRREIDRLRRVLLGPGHRSQQHIGLGTIRIDPPLPRERQDVRGALELLDRGAAGRRHGINSNTDH